MARRKKKTTDGPETPPDGMIIMMVRSDADTKTETKECKEVLPPGKYNVVFHNDDETPMVFVVTILVKVFQMGQDDAVRLMLHIHEHGKGVAGTYIRSVAESKANLVRQAAHEEGFPLKVTVEKE